jgi:hypothetical protein
LLYSALNQIKGVAMGLKLNWQRIGIILSVIVFIGFGIYAWIFEAQYRDRHYTMQLSLCKETLETEDQSLQYIGRQEDRDKMEAANQADYQRCKSEADEAFSKSLDASRKGMPLFLAKVLGIMVSAWLIESLIVETVRWIKRRNA